MPKILFLVAKSQTTVGRDGNHLQKFTQLILHFMLECTSSSILRKADLS